MPACALTPMLFRSPLNEATNGAAGLTVRIVDAELWLVGELDLDGVDTLRECLNDLAVYGLREIIVDTHELTFVDAIGVGALVTMADVLERMGIRMLVARPQAPVRRALDVARAIGPLRFRIVG